MSAYTPELDAQNPAVMFQSLDFIATMRRESTDSNTSEDLSRPRTNSECSTASQRPPIPERIIVTEDGVVRAIETIRATGEEEEERGRKRTAPSAERYYAKYGARPIID